MNRQPDLFSNIPDNNAFVAHDKAAFRREIVQGMMDLLAEAEAASTTPWTPQRTRVQARLFHYRLHLMRPDERDDILARFTRALERLGEHAVLEDAREQLRIRDEINRQDRLRESAATQ